MFLYLSIGKSFDLWIWDLYGVYGYMTLISQAEMVE